MKKYDDLFNHKVSYKDCIPLDELKEGEKISILSDSMLKTMFQNEKRIKYSAKFISYYLDISFEELLNNIHLSKNELDKDNEDKKGLRCDYVAYIDGTSINIEVNNNGSVDVLERNMEYAHRLYSRLVIRDKKENDYTQVIQFNLNNFSFVGIDKIYDMYLIQNDSHTTLSKKLIFIQIYIPNLIRKWYTLGVQKLDESEKYLLGLVLRNIDESKDVGGGIEIMEDYVDEAQEVSLDDDLRESYDKEWALKDLGLQQGILEGHELGLKDGIEQGKKEGLELGKKELTINLLKNNVPLDLISKSSDYTIEELEKMKKEIKN